MDEHRSEPDPDAADSAYRWLRERIVGCELLPGSRLSEHEVAAALGVSRTPVHEAVKQLARERLLDVRPRAGTYVARIDPAVLEEAILLRGAVEQMVAEKAAERATPAAVAALREALGRHADCLRQHDRDGARRQGDAFHAALAAAARLPGAWRVAWQAKAHTDRYRVLVDRKEVRAAAVIVEHGDLVRAIEARHPVRAAHAMRTHLRHIAPDLEIALALRPEYFKPG